MLASDGASELWFNERLRAFTQEIEYEKRLSMRKERISINFAMLVTSVPECCNRERLNTSTIVMIKLKTERHSDSIWKVGWQLPFESTSQVRGCPSPRLLRFIQ